MQRLNGTGSSPGTAQGELYILHRVPLGERRHTVADPEGEVLRFQTARRTAMGQLEALGRDTEARLGHKTAVLFEIHQMILDDDEFIGAVENSIRAQALEAACAVNEVAQGLMWTFSRMENEYMRARSADVLDVSRRVAAVLRGVAADLVLPPEPCILAADDLLPSEVARMTDDRVRAFVTAGGSAVSHTAILARAMGMPAVVRLGSELLLLQPGQMLRVDGTTGQVELD